LDDDSARAPTSVPARSSAPRHTTVTRLRVPRPHDAAKRPRNLIPASPCCDEPSVDLNRVRDPSCPGLRSPVLHLGESAAGNRGQLRGYPSSRRRRTTYPFAAGAATVVSQRRHEQGDPTMSVKKIAVPRLVVVALAAGLLLAVVSVSGTALAAGGGN